MIKNIFMVLAVSLPLLVGCTLFETSYEGGKNAEELVSEGSSAFVAGDYRDAIKAYTDLKDWYPFSKYAILAELKIADSHYALKEYEEAVVAYEDFERMHPRNEAVPYVILRNGLCWFNRIDTVDRDNLPAKNALAQFQRLVQRFPDTKEAETAQKNIETCLSNLAGHEMYVADFYLRSKKFEAAISRYEYLVENFPGSKESREALNKIEQCRQLAARK